MVWAFVAMVSRPMVVSSPVRIGPSVGMLSSSHWTAGRTAPSSTSEPNSLMSVTSGMSSSPRPFMDDESSSCDWL